MAAAAHAQPGPAGYAPHEELLFLTARAALEEPDAARARQLAGAGLDWARFVDLTFRHGVTLLVHRTLVRDLAPQVPAEVLDELHAHGRELLARDLALTGELLRLLALFRERGIGVLCLKGPALAVQAYGQVGLRAFTDLDLLVRPADAGAARRLLTAEGYRPLYQLTEPYYERLTRRYADLTFYARDPGCPVDLHWRLGKGYSFDPGLAACWKRAHAVELLGQTVQTLSPEDDLVFLGVHAAMHRWIRLSWLCDLAAYLHRRDGLDWCFLAEQLRVPGRDTMVLTGLSLAHELLAAPLPADWLARLRDDYRVRDIARRAAARFFAAQRDYYWPSADLYWRSMRSFRDRTRFLLEFVRPCPLEWELVPLPRAFSPLYYPLRVARLTCKYAARAVGFRRGPAAAPEDPAE